MNDWNDTTSLEEDGEQVIDLRTNQPTASSGIRQRSFRMDFNELDVSNPETREAFTAALKSELENLAGQAATQLQDARWAEKQADLKTAYAAELREVRAANGDKARLATKYQGLGLGDPTRPALSEWELKVLINNSHSEAQDRAAARVARGPADKRQAALLAAYEAERAQLRRGDFLAVTRLQAKYADLGMRHPGEEQADPNKRPVLSQSQKAELRERYQAELAQIRGQLYPIAKLQQRYRAMGLDI